MTKADNWTGQGRHMMTVCLMLVLVLVSAGLASGMDNPCIDRDWPWSRSDLALDPALRYGRLDNGMRYLLMANHQPRGRVALYLDVQAGSLNERENQRGLAHFIEHMLFNGTTHYPSGTLIKYFQSIGMGFGADTNAHTGFNETVYKLLLPDGQAQTLEKALVVIGDYARGALFLPEEIERERGVVLAEKRSRDSAAARVSRKRMQAEFAGSLVARRDPIGLETVIKNAGQDRFRAYYDGWYRPENMVLILVGDTDLDMARDLIVDHLSTLEGVGTEPACYDPGRVDEESREVVFLPEPDLGKTELGIGLAWNIPPRVDSQMVEKSALVEYLAASILDNRFKRLLDEPGNPLTQVRVYSGTFVRRLGYFSVYGSTGGDRWKEGLILLGTTMNQMLRYGVSEPELQRVRRDIMAELIKNEETAASRDSGRLAARFSRQLNSYEVIMSPAQERRLVARLLPQISAADVDRAMKRIWSRSRRVISVAGTATIDTDGGAAPDQVIEQVWARAMNEEVRPWQTKIGPGFPYLDLPEQQPAVSRVVRHPGINAVTTVLDSGVIINVIRTDFEQGQVRFAVHFGQGKMSEPTPGLARLAEAVVRESGVGRLDRQQLEEALSGHSFDVEFSVGAESFSFAGKGLSKELELMLRLVRTSLADPAFREQAYNRVMKQFAQMYAAMQESVDGMLQLKGDRFFAGGHPGYGFPDQDAFMALRLDQVKAWLTPVFARPDLEVSIVGDVDPDQAVALARKILGGFSGPEQPSAADRPEVDFPAGGKQVIRVRTPVRKAVVALGWLTDDYWDISRTRRLSVLASLFEDRLRTTVRERLGAAYSPVVYNQSSRIDRGFGVLRCLLIVAPDQVERIRTTVLTLASQLRDRGVEQDELHRIVAPISTTIRDMQRTNRYWLEAVLALSSRHPEQLQWPLTIVDDFKGITVEEISQLARRYLDPERAAALVIIPQSDQRP